MLNKKLFGRLSVKTGLLLGGGASFLLFISAVILFELTFNRELERIHNNLKQLVKTVEHSAQVAVYLDNEELASEITNGLEINDNVSGVILSSDTGMLLTKGSIDIGETERLVRVELYDPFSPNLKLGKLILIPNKELIQSTARERSKFHILLFGINTVFVIILVIVLVHQLLTQPLKEIAVQLHKIKPGKEDRLECPDGHHNDEIGLLVRDSNALLERVQTTLVQKNELLNEIQRMERKFRLLFDNAKVGIALISEKGELVSYNPAFENTIGLHVLSYLLEKKYSRAFEFIDDKQAFLEALSATAKSPLPTSLDIKLSLPYSGNKYLHSVFSRIEEQDETYIEVVLHDVSESVIREKKVRQESETDALTGIYNRRAATRIITQTLEEQDTQLCHALLLIDLDKFKPINDTYGHEAGDKVLIEAASRFSNALRKDDLVARWGGDEFIIFLSDTPEHAQNTCTRIASNLLKAMQQDIDLGLGNRGEVGLSIGIALSSEAGDQLDQLTDCADSAMYQVKQNGRNNFSFFSSYE